jgi:hypothetical protein
MNAPIGLTREERRALVILAGLPNGCTEGALRANGFALEMLGVLIHAGLAVAKPDNMKAGRQTITVVRLRITEAGRRALAL